MYVTLAYKYIYFNRIHLHSGTKVNKFRINFAHQPKNMGQIHPNFAQYHILLF